MDVLSNGKVRRTASEWRTLFRQFDRSGLTAPAFCQRESITLSSFHRWRKKLDATITDTAPESERFVEVAPVDGLPAFWTIELELPDGRMLRVRG